MLPIGLVLLCVTPDSQSGVTRQKLKRVSLHAKIYVFSSYIYFLWLSLIGKYDLFKGK